MDSGRISADGTVESLTREVSRFQTVKVTLGRVTAINRSNLAGLQSFEQSGDTILAILDRDPNLVPEFMTRIVNQGGSISALEVNQPTLREAFLHRTGHSLSP